MRDDWSVVEEYLKEYIGDFYEIEETSEKIYISADFPDEYILISSGIACEAFALAFATAPFKAIRLSELAYSSGKSAEIYSF